MAQIWLSAYMDRFVDKLKRRFKQRKGEGLSDRDNIKFLNRELRSMRAAVSMVGDLQPDQLDDQTKLWVRELREQSYDAEDLLDCLLARLATDPGGSKQKGLFGKMAASSNPIFSNRGKACQ
ncbi:hypothetical protein BS78_K195400 [Paspalum vaginatum]|uniref:Disease resistance N-terminal domain-containing protein n=1 Tax=Paspalum vaginatum TaxID=158149 RepID=A0A9W7XEN4_9POAL|nr:hypothetical protein BS78_K195400 [Paspalum vaginatum]